MERSDIGPFVYWTQPWGSAAYLDIVDETRQQVFHGIIPPLEVREDIHLALLVHQDSKKWARLQGRLWTEFGISLDQKNGLDCIEMIFTIKWNTTTSPYNILQATTKTPALLKIM
jgi:E3 ubiquitin-protein ligase SHPRH